MDIHTSARRKWDYDQWFCSINVKQFDHLSKERFHIKKHEPHQWLLQDQATFFFFFSILSFNITSQPCCLWLGNMSHILLQMKKKKVHVQNYTVMYSMNVLSFFLTIPKTTYILHLSTQTGATDKTQARNYAVFFFPFPYRPFAGQRAHKFDVYTRWAWLLPVKYRRWGI